MNVKKLSVIAGVLLSGLAWAAPAAADSLEWRIRSDYQYTVSLAFYSQDRSFSWPGGNQVYVVDDYAEHSYSLSCNYGESICYGAWVRGDSSKYWGVGNNNEQYCSNCCYVCGQGDTDLRILN